MKAKILGCALVAMALCSCSTIRHTSTAVTVESKVASFTVADLDVSSQKITKTLSWDFNPFKPTNIGEKKTNCTALMLQEAGADVLIEPEYIVERRGFLQGGSVTVIGFPAKFKNFHTMTAEEAQILKAVNESAKKEERKRFLFF